MKKLILLIVLSHVLCRSYAISFHERYKGVIGKYPVSFDLICSEGKLSGYYLYGKHSKKIPLTGELTGSKILINGHDDSEDVEETIKAKFDGVFCMDSIYGRWV